MREHVLPPLHSTCLSCANIFDSTLAWMQVQSGFGKLASHLMDPPEVATTIVGSTPSSQTVHLYICGGGGGAVTRILESHLSTNKWESGPDERPLSKPVKPPHKALLAPPHRLPPPSRCGISQNKSHPVPTSVRGCNHLHGKNTSNQGPRGGSPNAATSSALSV